MMLRHFRQALERIEGQISGWSAPSSLPSDGVRYLVAVSGGIDSMCLADLCLKQLGPERFAVAHCNFHLRGEESDGDEALVSSWASENGVELFKTDFDTEKYAAEHGVSIEMAARDLRYGWFGRLCAEHGFVAVMTAHNANDNAETLILNLLRGTGLRGITGMSEFSCTGEEGGLRIFRPILSVTRKQIEGYALAWRVSYREDSTNALSDYKRNRIRNEVFPQFGKINPSFVRTMNREMTYLSDASSIVDQWCSEHLPQVLVPNPSLSSPSDSSSSFRPSPSLSFRPSEASGEISISTPALLAIPQWRYLLYYILEPYGFRTPVLSAVEDLLVSGRTVSGKRFESDTHVLRAERQSLVLVPKMAGQAGNDVPVAPVHDVDVISDLIGDPFVPVRGAGAYHCNGRRFVVEVLPWSSEMPLKQPEGTLIFDADRLKFPFVCRRWRNGDWMIPLGMRGKKKLSDMFTDLKYSHQDKSEALVLIDCTGDRAEKQHIAALLGVRMDVNYKVSGRTTSIIRITL